MIASMQLECILAKANLLLFIEGKMMPGHLHGEVHAEIAAKKLMEFCAAVIQLFVWRLKVDRIFAETIGGLPRVAFLPAVRDCLQQLLKIGCCYFYVSHSTPASLGSDSDSDNNRSTAILISNVISCVVALHSYIVSRLNSPPILHKNNPGISGQDLSLAYTSPELASCGRPPRVASISSVLSQTGERR